MFVVSGEQDIEVLEAQRCTLKRRFSAEQPTISAKGTSAASNLVTSATIKLISRSLQIALTNERFPDP